MISEAYFTKKLVARANSSVKVRFAFEESKDDTSAGAIRHMFHYIQYFNSLGEDVDRALNLSIDQIMIANEFVPFLLPRSVRYDPNDRRTSDILIRTSYKGDVSELNYDDLYNTQAFIRSRFRRDLKDDVTPLSNIRVHKSLSEVIDKAVFKGSSGNDTAWAGQTNYVPIPIDVSYRVFFTKASLNATEKDVLDEFMRNFSFF